MEPGQVGIRIPSPLGEITYASEGDWRQAQELTRREQVAERRSYYDGTQYDADNARCLAELGAQGARTGEKGLARWIQDQRLPEHDRLHAYSTQIQEAVDFLTYQLAAEFAVEATDAGVQSVLDDCLDNSPELSGTSDDDELSVVNVTRESMVAMDCPVRVRFDPAEQSCWLECWPSDAVRMDFTNPRSDKPTLVMAWETHWRPGDQGEQRQVTIRREWEVQAFQYPGPDDTPELRSGPVTVQCVESWWEERPGGEDLLIDRIPTGVPFVPWGLLRASRRQLRRERGQSVISDRAMRTADRYDALEQYAFLAARHNSHATLAIVGDQAMVQLSGQDGMVHKDVADVLKFPGGTDVHAVVLPTDPALIEHQRAVLLDALFGCFGLARVDQSTLQGLGQVTGYALEILNTKTDSTFDALKTQFVRDWTALLNTVLDCFAHWTAAGQIDPESLFDPVASVVRGLGADPQARFPQRAMEIRTGTGGVTDAAQLRDDYVAGVVSRREVLRQRGYTNDEITQIEREIRDETQAQVEQQQAQFGGVEGGRFGAPAPNFGVVGGTSTTPTGRIGGVVNQGAEPRQAR